MVNESKGAAVVRPRAWAAARRGAGRRSLPWPRFRERPFEQVRDAKHRGSLAEVLEVGPCALDADDGGDVPPLPIRHLAALPEPAQFLQEDVLRWMHEEPAPA